MSSKAFLSFLLGWFLFPFISYSQQYDRILERDLIPTETEVAGVKDFPIPIESVWDVHVSAIDISGSGQGRLQVCLVSLNGRESCGEPASLQQVQSPAQVRRQFKGLSASTIRLRSFGRQQQPVLSVVQKASYRVMLR